MSRISITAAAAIGMTACLTLAASAESTDPETCPEAVAPAVAKTKIEYADSYMKVTPVTKIGRGKQWTFQLARPSEPPHDLDSGAYADDVYDDVLVTVRGKTGTRHSEWLIARGTRAKNPNLVVCVPNLDVGETVFFSVTIESLGMLDPRGDVVN